MNIRLLAPDDAAALWGLRLEALETDPRAFRETADEHRRRTVGEFAEYLARGDGFVAGAFEPDGSMVGMAGFLREGSRTGRIWGMYVRPAVRGGGAGRAMLELLIGEARRRTEIARVYLHVLTSQAAARRLYQSAGFHETPGDAETGPESVRMELHLSR